MTRRRVLGLVATAAVAVVIAAGVVVARDTGPAQAVRTPSGSTLALAGDDPVTGRAVSLADYSGRPVVINVWGSWCTGCRAEAADVQRFVEAHPEVQMLGIDVQDTERGARDFYARWGWSHPSIFDPAGKLAAKLALQGTPTTYFLDAEHRIVSRIVGATDLAGLEQGLQAALGAS